MEELAETYPTTVFPEAVGLRETDRQRLVDYGEMGFNRFRLLAKHRHDRHKRACFR